MIPPAGYAIAALTVMLWILWSDTIRAKRAPQAMYAARIALYLIAAAILILNRVRYPYYFTTTSTVIVVVAAAVGVFGAFRFARRLVKRI